MQRESRCQNVCFHKVQIQFGNWEYPNGQTALIIFDYLLFLKDLKTIYTISIPTNGFKSRFFPPIFLNMDSL